MHVEVIASQSSVVFWRHSVCMYLICQMQTTDKATTKQRTQWQDSKAQHALTTALYKKSFKKHKHHKHFQNQDIRYVAVA